MTENNIGKTLYMAAVHPATNDAAGFAALTWVKVNGLQTLPQFGVSHNMIDVEDLQTGFTSAVKGAGQGVDTTMIFRAVSGDTGQAGLKAAAENKAGVISIKIVKGTGTAEAPVSGDKVEYAQGIAHSYQPHQGDSSTHEGFTAGFRQNDFTITGTEPA